MTVQDLLEQLKNLCHANWLDNTMKIEVALPDVDVLGHPVSKNQRVGRVRREVHGNSVSLVFQLD